MSVEYLGEEEVEGPSRRPATFLGSQPSSAFRPATRPTRTPARPSRGIPQSHTAYNEVVRTLDQLGFSCPDPNVLEPGKVYLPRVPRGLEALEAIKTACERFAMEHNVSVFVCNPHGRYSRAIYYPGMIHIRFWSCDGETGTGINNGRSVPFSAFGGLCMNGGQTDGIEPSGQGVQLRDQDGTIIAEVVNNTVYVLFDLPHCEPHGSTCSRVQEVMTQILAMAHPHLELFEGEESEMTLDELRTAFRLAIAKLALGQPNPGNELGLLEQSVAAAARELLQTVQEREAALYERYKAAQGQPGSDVQLETILAMPVVARINVRTTNIVVFTKPISITYAGHTHLIGEFRIMLNFTGEPILIHNRTNLRDGVHHPHIGVGGKPSLGNITSMVPELMGQGAVAEVIELLIEFLSTYNDRNALNRIDIWR